MRNPWTKGINTLLKMGAIDSYMGSYMKAKSSAWDVHQTYLSMHGHHYSNNMYVDLRGHLRPHKNPTTGLYYFDGQFFYRKRVK